MPASPGRHVPPLISTKTSLRLATCSRWRRGLLDRSRNQVNGKANKANQANGRGKQANKQASEQASKKASKHLHTG